jgi:hypothetical protein
MRPRMIGAMLLLLTTLPLAARAMAGTTQAPPPNPAASIEHIKAVLQQTDPQRQLVASVILGASPDELTVVVRDTFHHAPYQERLQWTQAIGGAWRTATGHEKAAVTMQDVQGNHVGYSGYGGNNWVKQD